MKKIAKIVSVLALSSVFVNTFAADLEKIEVIDNGNISVNTTSDLVLGKTEIKWDLKVLKDYVVSFAVKDVENPRKVILNLTYDLEKNRYYTIIGIDGAEANMNFSTADKVAWEYVNSDTTWALKIEKINILDGKTVEIYYNEDLKAEEFIYRFLSDIPVKSKFGISENKLNVVLDKPLEQLTPYIIISNSLEDVNWKAVKMDETIYEFETQDNLMNFFPDLDLNAAKEENEIAVKEKEEGNVEEIAMDAKKTPDTWAATWILILLTLMIVWVFSLKFKKS